MLYPVEIKSGRNFGEPQGHVLMENRNGLLVQTFLTEANGSAERDAAMLTAVAISRGKRVTLEGDKNYDKQEFVRELRGMNITPHVARNDRNRILYGIARPTCHTPADSSPLRFSGFQTLSPRRYCQRPCSRQIMCSCR